MKVYELANTLNVKPLDLVEELKQRGFSVRNHSSELSEDEVQVYNEIKNTPIITPEIAHILSTQLTKKEIQDREHKKEKEKLAKDKAREKLMQQNQDSFPKDCMRVILKLSTRLNQERTDIADAVTDEIIKLMKKNPDEFSKKAKADLGLSEEDF